MVNFDIKTHNRLDHMFQAVQLIEKPVIANLCAHWCGNLNC